MPKITVIIPVYNTEKYLEKCLNSVIGQSFRDIEIVCVNDGSTDNSLDIMKKYAMKDSRIRVVTKENGGLVAARKTGLLASTGDYIAFLDSDDWLDADTYENVVLSMQEREFDLVCFNLFMDRGTASQEITSTICSGIYNRTEIMSEIVPRMRWDFTEGRTGVIAPVVCKLFKKSMLIRSMEQMDDQITLCEDAAITYPYVLRAQTIFITHLNGYHYVQREGSMWHSYNVTSYEKMLRYQNYMTQELVRLSAEYADITPDVMAQFEEQQTQAIIRVINNITRDVYGFSCNMVKWFPPYKQIQLNSRIVLYGAGDVGQAYYLKFYGDPNYNVVSWVDKKYQVKKGVQAPESIMKTEYDIVLIAVESESLADQIKDNLVVMGVDTEKIVWKKPQPVIFSFGNE